MKKIFFLFAGVFFTLAFLNSCGTKYAKEIIEVDSLQTLLNKSIVNFKNIDTVKLEKLYEQGTDNVIFIQKNYADTLSLQTAKFLERYNEIAQSFKIIRKNSTVLSNELNFSAEQLKNMKHDLEHNIGNHTSVREYCTKETQAIQNDTANVSAIINAIKIKTELFEQMNPQINQLIEEIKNKN